MSDRYRVVHGDLMAHDGPQVVPVNCVAGNMGKGLAKAYADRYQGLANWHRARVNDGSLAPGKPVLDRIYTPGHAQRLFLFPTKIHWRDPSTCDLVFKGLAFMYGFFDATTPPMNIGVPALGCGLGSLSFAVVEPMIQAWAAGLPANISVTVYHPQP